MGGMDSHECKFAVVGYYSVVGVREYLVRRWNGGVKSVAPYPAKIIRNNGKATRRRWKTDFQRVRSKREDVRWKRYSRHRERVTVAPRLFFISTIKSVGRNIRRDK